MNNETRARLEALEGHMLAAHAAIRALIACHPQPEKAIEEVSEHLDRFAGIALASTMPNEFVNALSKADFRILPTDEELASARARR